MDSIKLKRVPKICVVKHLSFLFFALAVIGSGCGSQRDSGFSKGMQNLTAHYNILFNAREILRQKQVSYATSFVDNYNQILSVYPDTVAQSNSVDKDLDAATVKANYLINEKEHSKYIGDAYLVLGQANYLEGNYFNGVEYFSYVIRSFPERKDLIEQAQVWKARTLIYLQQLPQAQVVIDSAIAHINPKKHPLADIYATKLEYDIYVSDYADGEEMARQAVHYCRSTNQRTRWTFILAQLQELNGHKADAYNNYKQIAKSNALFEMAFNANLNMIRINDSTEGVKRSRQNELLALMKNPDNAEFKDQIYYQAALLQQADKNIDGAVKFYNLSIRNSQKNQTQKGLAYLRLAEMYFDIKADYVHSKKYYDSTLTSLPVNYPGYLALQKKATNLALLADRLQIIAREDTLQALAQMDEKNRLAVIDKMVSDYVLLQQSIANANQANANAMASQQSGSFSGGSFYFDNAGAVGQGVSDFKKKWGNRKLEDDWRRSTRSSGDVTNNTSSSIQALDPDAPIGGAQAGRTNGAGAAYRKTLMAGLPLTPALLAQSNQRLYNAYLDIGDFYRDVLEDKKQAISVFETILRRFPNDPNKPAIYYNLYRLYGDIDPSKSDLYKNKLLKEYPETPFAKIIIDPDYIKKLGDKDAEYTSAYNAVFDLYAQKKYKEVITSVPELLKQYPGNRLSAQLYYLQTLSQGHYEQIGPFTDSLKQLMTYYPADKLIIPLVQQHLRYITENTADLATRNVVLADAAANDVPYTLAVENKKQTNYRGQPRRALPDEPKPKPSQKQIDSLAKNPPANKPAEKAAQPLNAATITPSLTASSVAAPGNNNLAVGSLNNTALALPSTTAPAATNADARNNPALNAQQDSIKTHVVVPSLFSFSASEYYFAVKVASVTTNLASSRFGIGQFNRANYAGQGIRHQLKAVGDSDQVIYVGHFSSFEDAKSYARAIVPVLPDIMKVPAAKYTFFIISKENLDKLADRKTLNSYIDYYQTILLTNDH